MKILHLNLKKKWYDMILSGEKKEEYREIKPYWAGRFDDIGKAICYFGSDGYFLFDFEKFDFDTIEFKNGYSKNAPKFLIECKGIKVGNAIPEWSDNWLGEVFVITLGEIIKYK